MASACRRFSGRSNGPQDPKSRQPGPSDSSSTSRGQQSKYNGKRCGRNSQPESIVPQSYRARNDVCFLLWIMTYHPGQAAGTCFSTPRLHFEYGASLVLARSWQQDARSEAQTDLSRLVRGPGPSQATRRDCLQAASLSTSHGQDVAISLCSARILAQALVGTACCVRGTGTGVSKCGAIKRARLRARLFPL